MYQHSYAETIDEAPHDARLREKQAFDHAIDLLCIAKRHGIASSQCDQALYFTDEFWSILMDDLAHSESDLPPSLRASLISIGIWVLKETDKVRHGNVAGFDAIIEINEIIRDGLR